MITGQPNTLCAPGDPETLHLRVTRYLKKQARADITRSVNRHAATLGVSYNGISVKDTRSRWGSCTADGKLSFSWRLIMAPSEVLDYVAAHECAHLLEMNHSIDLSLDDDGIVDRAFNAYAAQSGEDPQQLRNQTAGLLAMAPMMASGSGIDMELATEASTALSSFITDPKTLTISLNPATPIKMSTFAEMEDPSTLTKSSLGFSASNE